MQRQPKKILVIDDEPDILDVIMQALEGGEYEVIVAADGPQGLDRAREHRPDLIILDLKMPGMDGFEVAQRLKMIPETQKIPVIMLTAHGAVMNIFAAQKQRVSDFLIKPFGIDELLDVISRHI